jgi:hypothetical protein
VAGAAKMPPMPEMSAMLLENSLDRLAEVIGRCGGCRRAPLPGERLHELESGRLLCELCFRALPDQRRVAVRSERVSAGERRLAVVPKAA